MMQFYRRRGGFTLLELMIVVIIIGILASLAVPRFISVRNKAITAEAVNMLGSIRSSQMRYYLENNNSYATAVSDLDLTVPSSQYFTYTGADAAQDPAHVGEADGIAGTSVEGVTVTITEDGTITTTGL